MEEMQRTLTFFDWLACQWEGKATAPSMSSLKMDSITATGISAYAHKQAAMYCKMFVNDWYQYLNANSLGSSWLCTTVARLQPNNAACLRTCTCAVLHPHSPVNTILLTAISAWRLKNGRLKLKTRPSLPTSIILKNS